MKNCLLQTSRLILYNHLKMNAVQRISFSVWYVEHYVSKLNLSSWKLFVFLDVELDTGEAGNSNIPVIYWSTVSIEASYKATVERWSKHPYIKNLYHLHSPRPVLTNKLFPMDWRKWIEVHCSSFSNTSKYPTSDVNVVNKTL